MSHDYKSNSSFDAKNTHLITGSSMNIKKKFHEFSVLATKFSTFKIRWKISNFYFFKKDSLWNLN